MSLILINRGPEPGEVAVPREGNIYLEIHSTGADDVDDGNTQVFVNGVLAYDGGVFQAGFTGPDSLTASPIVGIRQIRIDPTSDFSSEEIVSVRVTSSTVVVGDPLFTIDESYSFTIEDFTAPTVLSAFAVDCKTVRVKFSEAMRSLVATNSDDALNPENYTIDRNNEDPQAAVNPNVVSIVESMPDEFDVLTDIEMSFGVTYVVTVLSAEDVVGNEVVAPLNVATFIAFTPTVPAGRRLDLYRMLPVINRRDDATQDLRRFTSIIQDVINVLLLDIDRWTDILDFRLAAEPFIDAILCGLGNPFMFDLSTIDKQRLAAVLVNIYREKGLAEGIENATLFFLGLSIVVQACDPGDGWILGESELGIGSILASGDQFLLYSFEIVSPIILTIEQQSQITKIADYMKPAHTHLKRIVDPTPPVVLDHWEIGESELGVDTLLH